MSVENGLSFLDSMAMGSIDSPNAHAWPPVSGEIGDYLRTPPPDLHWFAKERLLADRAHLLTGIGGSSKTRLLYHLAIAGIIGRCPWGWDIQNTGSAALFLAEDSTANVHRTLAAIVEHAGLSAEEVAKLGKHLKVFPLAGHDAKLLALIPGAGLIETSNARGLIETCRTIPDLVIVGLDPALGLTDGDESNPTHQRRLGELADRIALELGVCVVLASHAAKALQSADEVGSHSSRGSGAITDAVRGEYVLRTMTTTEAKRFGIADIEQRKAYVQLLATKGNELPPAAFAPVWLVRSSGGVLSAANLSEVEREAGNIGQREIKALALLKEMTTTGAVRLAEWRRECVARGLIAGTEQATDRAIHRIKNALLSAGLIEHGIGRGVFLAVQDMES